MKVKAKIERNEFYRLEKDKEYNVEAVLYFVTPFFNRSDDRYVPSGFVNPIYSSGFLPNEVVYLVMCETSTGRTTMARFLASDFDVVEGTTEENWSVGVIDVAKESEKIPSVAKNEQAEKIYEINKRSESLIVVLGDKKYHNPEYLYAACEDSL